MESTTFYPSVAVAECRPVEEPRGGRVRRILPEGSVITKATADEFILEDGELAGGGGDREPAGGRLVPRPRQGASARCRSFSPLAGGP